MKKITIAVLAVFFVSSSEGTWQYADGLAQAIQGHCNKSVENLLDQKENKQALTDFQKQVLKDLAKREVEKLVENKMTVKEKTFDVTDVTKGSLATVLGFASLWFGFSRASDLDRDRYPGFMMQAGDEPKFITLWITRAYKLAGVLALGYGVKKLNDGFYLKSLNAALAIQKTVDAEFNTKSL